MLSQTKQLRFRLRITLWPWWLTLIIILGFTFISPSPVDAYSFTNPTYEEARATRILHGHTAAIPLYQEILARNPQDMTAATRIAACKSTPVRQDKACPMIENKDMKQLKYIFDKCNYDNRHVQQMCGIREGGLGYDSQGPLFLKPVPAGSPLTPPTLHLDRQDDSIENSSLVCLVTLFLLGFAVPRRVLMEKIMGGNETILLMEKLGLAFPFSGELNMTWEEQYIVPYVHIFPMDVHIVDSTARSEKKIRSIRLVTDLHPTILGQTTVGEKGDGAVMYIGPDSLALVQHLPLEAHVQYLQRKMEGKISQLHILDLCTGSGIQALATLVALDQCFPLSKALCVDINERALRFTRFNAILNDIDSKRLDLLNLDLQEYDADSSSSQNHAVPIELNQRFDIILSNPPFIPVPQSSSYPLQTDTAVVIQRKYGLYSSGGTSGEIILCKVMKESSRLLRRDGGLLAIVSEFMNPPTAPSDEVDNHDHASALIARLKGWWGSDSACKGILFTNQFPVNADEYSRRRASNEAEYIFWRDNLKKSAITCVSPGLLFLLTQSLSSEAIPTVSLKSNIVKKTEMGSIWTPHNKLAITFTRESWSQFYNDYSN